MNFPRLSGTFWAEKHYFPGLMPEFHILFHDHSDKSTLNSQMIVEQWIFPNKLEAGIKSVIKLMDKYSISFINKIIGNKPF